jgi:hypothetical protein
MTEATRLGGNTGDTYSHELVSDEHRTYEKSPSVALIFQVVALSSSGLLYLLTSPLILD